ncbi:hypothetical protein DEU56DRAFT_775227 [Suillus clintonianus]|uniref:uncharacterized protein n=1 Tax=Suillus clintonianus TaxID=1904413 RepID=UPI001B874771|nr:uncharacterized protein DEU56DRAFT_775227 [Suillus clintonianus]KAG2153385.1 hypothetical protein DEU56DRAFT_775227 [Suillus clintonianus]
MSTNTLPCLSRRLKALVISISHAERQGQPNACLCYPMWQFILDQLQLPHHGSSLPDIQCHRSHSNTASEWIPHDDSYLNMFNTPTDTVEAPVSAWDAGSPIVSYGPSPMPDFVHHQHPLPIIPLGPDNGTNLLYHSELDHMEGFNLDSSPLPVFYDGFPPDPNMTHSVDYVSPQIWDPHALPQSSDTSSSNRSVTCDYSWANEQSYNYSGRPLSHDIQPHAQNSNNVYLPNFCDGADLPSPTSTLSEFSSLVDDFFEDRSCRWGGSCSSLLTVDKSEVAKHLQTNHGVKPGGDKDKMPCSWDGCDRVMKKESISRHIVAVHLSDKTECTSCGKQFARLDSKLRHLKNSKRECREPESHDSRVKRRRLSLP